VSMARDDSDAGFTLLETLVALVIFLACYILVQQAVSIGWRGIQVAHSEAKALQIAQARLAAAGLDGALKEGGQSGETPDGYRWTMNITRYGQPSADRTPGRAQGFWVEVAVDWREGPRRRNRSLELATVKLVSSP